MYVALRCRGPDAVTTATWRQTSFCIRHVPRRCDNPPTARASLRCPLTPTMSSRSSRLITTRLGRTQLRARVTRNVRTTCTLVDLITSNQALKRARSLGSGSRGISTLVSSSTSTLMTTLQDLATEEKLVVREGRSVVRITIVSVRTDLTRALVANCISAIDQLFRPIGNLSRFLCTFTTAVSSTKNKALHWINLINHLINYLPSARSNSSRPPIFHFHEDKQRFAPPFPHFDDFESNNLVGKTCHNRSFVCNSKWRPTSLQLLQSPSLWVIVTHRPVTVSRHT